MQSLIHNNTSLSYIYKSTSASSWDQVNLWISVSGMFCFCLQSSLLKLQACEVEGGPSLGPSPEEQKSPCGPVELGGKEGKTLALCHSVPADENSPPGTYTCLSVCLTTFLLFFQSTPPPPISLWTVLDMDSLRACE